MTKVYLVKSVRTNQNGFIYEVTENVFTNRKKAQNYLEWIQKRNARMIPSYTVIRYRIDKWNIDTNNYKKLPF